MAALQCVVQRGSLGGLPVNFVRLCDRTMTHERRVNVKSYRDLDKHPELVLYEGHIFKEGIVHLKKRGATVAK